MIVIGIVGSPAGGKSTVATHLQGLGATWIDADRIARDVLERPAIQSQLIAHFGSEITDNRGQIDRSRLAAQVFGDDDLRRAALTYLESVIHPETRRVITQRLKEALDQGVVAAILDVPLLFKSHWDRCCDEIWCVDSSIEIRQARAAARGWSPDELLRRENNQLPIEEKRRLSNFLIRNNGSLLQLAETIDARWSSLIRRHGELPTTEHCLSDHRRPTE